MQNTWSRQYARFLIIKLSLMLAMICVSHVQAFDQPVVCDQLICDGSCCDGACCDDISFRRSACRSIYGEFQYLRLRAYGTEEFTFVDEGGSGERNGFRLLLGYQTAEGIGIRLRHLNFDGFLGSDSNGGLNADYWDLEVTERFRLGSMNAILSAGYRHADWEQGYLDDFYARFEGDGVTFGGSLQRDLGCHLALFGWAQHSVLFGVDDYNDLEDQLMSWTEIQLGGQYATKVSQCTILGKLGVEVQQHLGVADVDTEDAGLLGWFCSGEIRY